jgi:hypothetical protein
MWSGSINLKNFMRNGAFKSLEIDCAEKEFLSQVKILNAN